MEAAWFHSRGWSPALEAQWEAATALPPRDAALARKANRRLHDRYAALTRRGKSPNLVKVAVARELAGFVWALATGAE